MHIFKLKNQFNAVFVFIIILTLLSFFTANYSVSQVSNSYENVLDHSLPIMNKSSQVAQLSAQLEAHLIQLHFDALNSTRKDKIYALQIDKTTQLWSSIQKLLDEFLLYNIINNEQILDTKYETEEYLKYMPELLQQVNLLLEAKKNELAYIGDIETIINYNNKILLAEIESFWHELLETVPTKDYEEELEYSNQFYKNSIQLLSYFRQVFLTTDIATLNTLKRNSVLLFKKMNNAGSSNYEYKLFADTLLEKVKHIYAGDQSLFKVRYDVLRLTNVTDSLIQQQIDTANKIEKISDTILLQVQATLAKQKVKIKDDVYQANQYLIFIIIISFIITFFAIWFLVNRNLIKRITEIRAKTLELSKGNTEVNINIYKEDELGDMEQALVELKGYVGEAQRLSTTDQLTGLLNQNQFKKNLEIEVRRHSRQNQSLSLAIIDIDYFKNYNDSYGHPQGDKCLKKVGFLISETCQRAGEYAYRIGGEEFAVIMPNTSAQEQYQKLQKLQDELEKCNIKHNDSKIAENLTISIGIYSCHKKFISADDFYQNADKALYNAKKARNDIVVSKCVT